EAHQHRQPPHLPRLRRRVELTRLVVRARPTRATPAGTQRKSQDRGGSLPAAAPGAPAAPNKRSKFHHGGGSFLPESGWGAGQYPALLERSPFGAVARRSTFPPPKFRSAPRSRHATET